MTQLKISPQRPAPLRQVLAFTAQANAQAALYGEAEKDRLAFWDKQAEALIWEKKWDKTLEWESPYAKWFVGGKLNATVSALDRHIAEGNGKSHRFSL